MMILALTSLTSCESNLDEQPEVIIEPDDVPMFEFGEDGIPFRWHSPYLSAEMQEAFRKEAIGYGWRWMQTNEIKDDGWVKTNGFYDDMFGMSPQSYYIVSDSEIVTFFHSDVVNEDIWCNSKYQMNPKTGLMTAGMLSSYGYPWSIYMRVWSIYMLSGKWYMSCLEPLCTRTTDSKEMKVIWGTSQYVRMTDDELRQMKEKHNFEQ